MSNYHKSIQHSQWVAIFLALAMCLTPLGSVSSMAAPGNPPVDPGAPWTPKVTALVNALTLDEKLSLVHGGHDPASLGQAGYLPGVPRLGIPERRDADALGINVTADATALPARLGLGATFSRSAALAAGQLEGSEGRALGVDLMYGPQVDLTRQPNWGRNNTTYGEDPYLSGHLAAQEVSGVQSQGLMDEVKHFTLYNGQDGVAFFGPAIPTIIDDQTAHELYLAPFETAVTQGQPSSVMCSYQTFQIQPLNTSPAFACANSLTLNTILRDMWGFKGFVLSDYGATHSLSILDGLDQQYPNADPGGFGGGDLFSNQLKALADPTSPTYNPAYAAALDQSAARVLYAYERFGLLQCASPSGPATGCSLPARPTLDKAAGIATTEMLSEKSAVLLKNDDNLLPLKRGDLKQGIAVIGPTARQVMVNGGQGERSRGFPDRDAINPLQMLQNLAPKNSNISFSPGIDWFGTTVPASALAPGLTRTESDSSATQVDATIDYPNTGTLNPGVSYTWNGTLSIPADGTYYFWLQQSFPVSGGFFGPPSVSLTIDGENQSLSSPGVPVSTYPSSVVPAGGSNTGVAVSLASGAHTIQISTNVPASATQPITFRLAWSSLSASIQAAVNAAKTARVAVVFADDNGASNANIINSLAPNQDMLIQAVANANHNTVVVLSTGDPVLMPWLGSVKSVLEMWYPGQEGGTATARLLLGQADPGGKLPITFPASAADTPFGSHPERIHGNGTDVPFSEGLLMGYRWYDQQNIQPLFEFGYGLSYTQFKYSKLNITPTSDGGFDVSFRVQNVGNTSGDEVPQVYLGPSPDAPANVQQVVKKLVQFDRISLAPGHWQDVSLHLTQRDLSYWSTSGQDWVVGTGSRAVLVGASSRDIRLQGFVQVSQ
jgi:beta-glucosidase